MLGDLHYGLSFSHFYDSYNPDIARERVMRYAEEIIRIGEECHASTCYVSLMGDLISGANHTTIRLENTESVSKQIIGAAELIANFLHRLAEAYSVVIVNAVDGNHSRLDPIPENALRHERLDSVILKFVEAHLSQVKNVRFHQNEYDSTIADFKIFGKTYIAVHGDMDVKQSLSSMRIQELIGEKIDYFLMGHMHIPEMRVENTTYIRNGAIVSGGDDYTSRRRLFGPAAQVCLTVSARGVESVHPVML